MDAFHIRLLGIRKGSSLLSCSIETAYMQCAPEYSNHICHSGREIVHLIRQDIKSLYVFLWRRKIDDQLGSGAILDIAFM
jgi:hypothetical protein